jgi:hypothetical protein
MSFLDSIADTVSDLAGGIVYTAEDVVDTAGYMAKGAAYDIGDFFKGIPGALEGEFLILKDVGTSLFGDAIHDVTHPLDFAGDVAGAICHAGSDTGDALKSFVEGVPNELANEYAGLNWLARGIPDTIVHAATHPADTASDIFHAVTHPGDTASSIWEDLSGLL